MRDLRIQYVLTFGMLGTVLPYVSVFFREAGLSEAQVGYAWAIWSAGLMLSPALLTMLADAHIDPRRLLTLASIASGAGLLCLGLARGPGTVLGIWAVYCLTSMPILPLQDGIHFSQQRRLRERGGQSLSYPKVRVWGTIGYIVPSLLLFVFLQRGMSLRVVLMTGAAFAALAALQASLLHDPRANRNTNGSDDGANGERRLPTLAAARVLLRPNLLVFVLALLLLQGAATVHGAFYPIYLTEHVGIHQKWLGQISNLAVFIEIFFVYGCGTLMRRFGIKNLLLAAISLTALRLGLLAFTTNAWVAVGTQVFHGIMLMATGVIPQMVLDDAAEDRFRHSMQGLYVMIGGTGRSLGNMLAGPIAAWSLAGLYGVMSSVCVVAGGMILLGFRDPVPAKVAPSSEESVDEPDTPGPACAPAPALSPAPAEAS